MAHATAPIVAPVIKPLRLLWPPWRLGKSVKSAHEVSVELLSDLSVWAEWCFAVLVVMGVASEFVIAAIHPEYDSWLGRWGAAYGDLLVAMGVAGEVIASVVAHVCQNELTRRSNDRLAEMEFVAGFAQERAAKAELETAQLRAGLSSRFLSNEQKAIFAGLNGHIKAVNFMFSGGYEPMQFGMQILTALHGGGVESTKIFPSELGLFAWTGIQLWVLDMSDDNPLVTTFRATGLLSQPGSLLGSLKYLSLDVPKDTPLVCIGERSPIEQAAETSNAKTSAACRNKP